LKDVDPLEQKVIHLKSEGFFCPGTLVVKLLKEIRLRNSSIDELGRRSGKTYKVYYEEILLQTWVGLKYDRTAGEGHVVVATLSQSSGHFGKSVSIEDITGLLRHNDNIFGIKAVSRNVTDPGGTRGYLKNMLSSHG